MKETAIEWLLEELNNGRHLTDELVEKAKEIERQQIIMAFWNSKHSLCDENTNLLYLAEQYYKAKFNK